MRHHKALQKLCLSQAGRLLALSFKLKAVFAILWSCISLLELSFFWEMSLSKAFSQNSRCDPAHAFSQLANASGFISFIRSKHDHNIQSVIVPLALIEAASRFLLPSPVPALPCRAAQRSRAAFGCTAMTCYRLATMPSSSNFHFRATLRDGACILARVMASHILRAQVRSNASPFAPLSLHDIRCFQAAAARRVAGKSDVFEAAISGDASLVADHIIASPACVHIRNNGSRWGQGNAVALLQRFMRVFVLFLNFCCSCSAGCNLLHLTSRNGHVEVCRLLVACKADINDKDNWCDSCLSLSPP